MHTRIPRGPVLVPRVKRLKQQRKRLKDTDSNLEETGRMVIDTVNASQGSENED